MSVATSGRKIFKMSDDTATGVRAMTVRRSLDQLASYKDNATSTKNKIDSAEKILGEIAEVSTQVYERFNYAMNGTNSVDERNIIAQEFRQLRDEIVASSNSQFADRYLFGGTNTMTAPFSVFKSDDAADARNGKLMYNNVFVHDIPGPLNEHAYLLEDAAYVDVGLGLAMVGNSQEVNSNTAIKNTINGLGFMGTGVDNIYDTNTGLITMLENNIPDIDEAGVALDKMKSMANTVNMERTRLGSDSAYLEFTTDRLLTEEMNLITRQDSLEFRDPAEVIMDFSYQEFVYNAALQMGTRLLQQSLFDYIR
jgi:flagellin-like hook-associated protein FlgL